MDGDRKPCNRGTCNKPKCSEKNKAPSRSPQISTTTTRPGAANPFKPVASPFFGGAANSTQVLYIEPHFSETPSEYDIFYDCYSDVELEQTQIDKNALINTKRGGGPNVATPTGSNSKMLRDALKQVIVNAQALLVDYESGGRGGRRGCGSRCRCDVRNIKPQTRTVQLEVTAKVANNKSAPPSNIRIDPITFTIPLKLHVQGHKQSQQNIAYTPSQQSYEGRRPFGVHEHAQNMPCMFNSMEPIRTAIITGTRQEAVSCVPMEGTGPVPAFDFHAALLQQMTGIPAGLLQFPMPGVEEYAQMGASKVQIRVPTAHPPLRNLGSPMDLKMTQSKSRSNCGEACSMSQHQVPSVAPLATPSLAPVNQGNFLATIAKSSMPSVANAKSQQFSETGSQGVCVLCGRGGDGTKTPPAATSKGPCNMCARGKPQQVAVPPKPTQQKGPCDKCAAKREGAPPTEPLVVLVAPQPSAGIAKRSCKMCSAGAPATQIKTEPMQQVLRGPCGMCTRAGKPTPPAPPPLEEPLIKVKGPCGVCTKGDSKPLEMKPKRTAPSTTATGGPCGVCSIGGGTQSDAGRSHCLVCGVKVESPGNLDRGMCGNCAAKAERAPPMEAAAKMPCGICATRTLAASDVQQGPSAICTHTETGPMPAKKEPCDICSKGAPPPPATGKAACPICSKGATTVTVTSTVAVKPPCNVCGRGAGIPVIEEKGPCAVCGRGASSPAAPAPTPALEKGPCGICSRGAAPAPAPTPALEKGPCGICTRGAAPAPPPLSEKGPCGICSRGAAPPPVQAKAPCGICARGAAPAPAPTPALEKGPCGICARGAAPAPPPLSEKGPCGICSRGAAPPPVQAKAPCGICARGAAANTNVSRAPCESASAPSVMSIHKEPCDICSRPATPKQQKPMPTTPCNICKKGPAVTEVSPDICKICKKVQAPPPEQPTPLPTPTTKEPCEICSKVTGTNAVVIPTHDDQPCGKCGDVGAPCGMCSQPAPTTVPTTSNVNQYSGWCCPPPSAAAAQAAPCISPTLPETPTTTTNCGTCMNSQQSSQPPPSPSPVIDYNCGTCLLPKPKEICSCFLEIGPKYYKALPQHKDIHICSPCRYDPSPLIDDEGKVFCPRNCGCCLCPWRKRGTDSQIEQIKHEKIKVCKCRAKGSIFIDYTSRAKCSNTSYFDCCPCRERAEAKYLEMFGEEMWTPNEKLRAKVRGEPVRLEDVVEYRRASIS